ncbi:hypothetical protein [Arthrobacter methylotrophus]|uniref:Uncharacterized protein n=1 Tax=Arthrobacter methylotrophus TaxID=121291 RepID=A0ABV5USK2_9MICC
MYYTGRDVAGYQPKTILALLDGVWHTGVDGATSTHIIKPVVTGNEHALHAEAYCLDLYRIRVVASRPDRSISDHLYGIAHTGPRGACDNSYNLVPVKVY